MGNIIYTMSRTIYCKNGKIYSEEVNYFRLSRIQQIGYLMLTNFRELHSLKFPILFAIFRKAIVVSAKHRGYYDY